MTDVSTTCAEAILVVPCSHSDELKAAVQFVNKALIKYSTLFRITSNIIF